MNGWFFRGSIVGKYTIYLDLMGSMLGFVFFFDIFADSILWD